MCRKQPGAMKMCSYLHKNGLLHRYGELGSAKRLLLVVLVTTAIAVTPPAIVRVPPHELLFHVASAPDEDPTPFLLECDAVGDPEPNYEWTKNNESFDYAADHSRVSKQRGRGTLVFTAPEDRDEGLYQCRASNEHGTALLERPCFCARLI
ncbi:hypothetical protein HPB48_018686 [Haemaphysalis longicornis]|uniref:Ig-like domain-containing protein n=1 Tax=Haemaphysalis longicornis TaxID=44386 RepID=A0A9J6FQ58_HAELO|nr:hypothetical protein HPB48_018686 [Haemaphysalis longicornis]